MNTTSVIISTITMMVAITSAEAAFIPTSPCKYDDTTINISSLNYRTNTPHYHISLRLLLINEQLPTGISRTQSVRSKGCVRPSGSVGNNNNKRRRSDDFVSGNFDNDDNRGYDKFEDGFSNAYTPQQ